MSKQSHSGSGSVSAPSLMGIVLVTLKLTGVEPVNTWSWWWVTAPFWGGLALILFIFTMVFLVALVIEMLTENRRQPQHKP